MKNEDAEMIQRTLAGDNNAFSELVRKYQKQVHALVWRKTGDFHLAEDITQDTFLKAYQQLHTLKEPHRFAGWLYVIATRRCLTWFRKKRLHAQVLEKINTPKTNKDAYSHHVAEEQAQTTDKTQQEVVKKLLATLPESERTVITLYYFGEMTCEKMSEFLGVSANTIKSRLRRARNRMKQEEPMIREAITNFNILPNLIDNIMQEITELKPTTPTVSKPLIPWMIGAASTVLVMLMLGIGSQHLSLFQQSYSLDAQSETTVELVDAPIVQNVAAMPDVRNQLVGRSDRDSKNDGSGNEANQVLGNDGDYTQWNLPKGAKTRLGKGTINGISFSPDGTQIAVGSATGVWIYDTNTGAELTLLTDHKTPSGKVVFSPDGKTLASGLHGDILLWDIETGKLIKTFKNKVGYIIDLKIIDDGKTLLCKNSNGSVRLWDISTDVIKDFLPPPPHGASPLPRYISGYFAKKEYEIKSADLYLNNVDNRGIFAVGEADGKIQLEDAITGRHLKTLQDHEEPISQLLFSPDGTLLVATDKSNTPPRLWDVTTGKLLKSLTQNPSKHRGILSFSKDGKILACQSWIMEIDQAWAREIRARKIELWDVATKTLRTTLTLSREIDGAIQELAFSADSNRVVGTYRNGKIRIWDVNTGDELFSYNKGHTPRLDKLVLSPNNSHLAAVYGDTITLWDTLNFTQLPNLIDIGPYSTFAFSFDGSTLTSTSEFRYEKLVRDEFVKESVIATLSFLDTHTGKKISEYPVESHKGEEPEILEQRNFSSGGNSIIGMTNPVIFSQDGYMLATVLNTLRENVTDDYRFTIFLWEVWEDERRRVHTTLKGHTDKINVLALTPNGDTLASGSDDGTIRLWDTSAGTQISSIPSSKTDALAFSMDGKILASVNNFVSIQLWDVGTGKQLTSLNGQNEVVTDLKFSSDNNILASGNLNGTIQLWDISTGKQLGLLKGHTSRRLINLVFSSDGKTLVSGGSDGDIFIWNVPN
ncbi:MAG: sigma-70 family RNA polymerase sigma factor [Candidatus Poribacteria bacterium]|nr:sigma-70 family RNA polymerase sigma factor [Candidatus Poribacteria bacterium]